MSQIDSTALTAGFVEVRGGQLRALSQGQPVGQVVTIGPEPCVIGRGAGSQVVVDDPEVSISHCELTATSGGLRVRDLSSRNGTFANQARVEAGGSFYLTADARLKCGQTWFLLKVTGSQEVALSRAGHFGELVGRSDAMRRIYAQIDRIAPSELTVLITGETGTGKELVAKAIHQASPRAAGPFVIVDCTSIPASLAESTLFGHEKGAFTGAVSRKASPFVEAEGGTIFFDELGELPVDLQPKLLRVLQERQVQAVGSNRLQSFNVRVIAATRRDLHVEINKKRFRDDLYYRLAQAVIRMPSLRDRPEDIAQLIPHFLEILGDPGANARIDSPTRERLVNHDWPGNVRELANVIAAAYANSNGGPFEVAELLAARGDSSPATAGPFQRLKREMVAKFERDYFSTLHQETGGNLSEMSRRSGVARSWIRAKLTRYGLGVSE